MLALSAGNISAIFLSHHICSRHDLIENLCDFAVVVAFHASSIATLFRLTGYPSISWFTLFCILVRKMWHAGFEPTLEQVAVVVVPIIKYTLAKRVLSANGKTGRCVEAFRLLAHHLINAALCQRPTVSKT